MVLLIVGEVCRDVLDAASQPLRYGGVESRFTQELNAARVRPLSEFLDEFEASLNRVSEPGSQRVRDPVDLQLLDRGENLDLVQVNTTRVRLFDYRRLQAWPPVIQVGAGWDDLYQAAIEGVDVLPDIDAAVAVTNDLIARIADASAGARSRRG